ncbi:MAG TPA: hypothetical protein VMZ53_10510 [Kofleriaceae bacterium]|nr:hypothetical protein [Kofleriaceae bacterium]
MPWVLLGCDETFTPASQIREIHDGPSTAERGAMHRYLLFLPLCAGCLDSSLPKMDALVSSSHVSASAEVSYRRCDGEPCTYVELELFRDEHYASDTSAQFYIDYAQPMRPKFEPNGGDLPGGRYTMTVHGWIEHVRINANVGSDSVYMEASRAISNPDEANIVLPYEVVLGARPTLQWDGQGSPYSYNLLYATQVPALRFGFLATLAADNGAFEFDRTTFTAAGSHTVALYRQVDYEATDDDVNAMLVWSSEWQQIVQVVEAPNG